MKLPSEVPVMTLPNVTLFPQALLPLYIFEPRYRRMLADCATGDQRFGLALPGIAHEAPALGAVGCVAEIRGTQAMPDGRSNIVVQGATRFLLTRYLEDPAPYLVAMVEAFDDREGSAPSGASCTALSEAFMHYLPALRELNDLEPDTRALPTDPTALSFHVSASLDVGAAEKQALLEIRSTAERVELLLEMLGPLSSAIDAGLRTRRKAHSNGKSHHPPEWAGE
jgi:Lon protease-like protein